MKNLLILIFALSITACGSTKQYAGPDRSPDEIAVLHVESIGPVQVNEINGKFRGIGLFKKFEFLPGNVDLLVAYNPADKPNPGKIDLECDVSFQPISFNAVAGNNYALDYELGELEWKLQIKNTTTNKMVTEQKVAAVKKKSGNSTIDLKTLFK